MDRKAAKARRKNVCNAKKTGGVQNQQFSMEDAIKDRRKRESTVRYVEQNMAVETQEAIDKIMAQGAYLCEMDSHWENLRSWMDFCFRIITKIRDEKLPIEYNREWKEAKKFVAAKVKK